MTYQNTEDHLAATMTYSYERELRPEDEFWGEHPIEYYQLDMARFEPKYGSRSYPSGSPSSL
jgi:hypothetical protein